MTKRLPIALFCAVAMLPLAACYDDDYAPRGYGPPPPPPPPPGGYYDGPPPPRDGGYYRDDVPPPPPPPPGTYREGYRGGYREAPPPPNDDNATYYPDRYYRPPARGVGPRPMTRDDRVYRGGDGRYYCRRSDGTTGTIVGAVAGGVLGNLIDGGRNRVLGTLLGGGGGALLGRSIDQNQVVCR